MEEMNYLSIPKKLNWELFRKITEEVKHNISDKVYDVVQAAFYMNDGVKDYLRVYKPKASIELLEEIRNAYVKKIKNYS